MDLLGLALAGAIALAFAPAGPLFAVEAARVGSIAVGPNVRVSAAHPGRLHHEVVMAASPKDPKKTLDAANGQTAAGAIWDFTTQLKDGRLAPGQTSSARRLRFRLNQLSDFKIDPRGGLGSLLSIEVRVFGKEEK